MGSQAPEYRRLYAQFTRAAKNPGTPAEVQNLFSGHSRDLFRAWLTDNKTWSGATLCLQQETSNSTELSDDFANKTARRRFGWRLCVGGHWKSGGGWLGTWG